MSKGLYVVTLTHEVVVLADDGDTAADVAVKAWRRQPGDCGEPTVDQSVEVTMACQIPDGWGIPFGDDGRDWDAVRYLPRVSP